MDYKVTDTELTSVANAIRTKGGTSGQLTFPNGFVTAIGNIPSGGGGGGENDHTVYVRNTNVISASNILAEFEIVPIFTDVDFDGITNVGTFSKFCTSCISSNSNTMQPYVDLGEINTDATIYGIVKYFSGSETIAVCIGYAYNSGNTPGIYVGGDKWFKTVYGGDLSTGKSINVYHVFALAVNDSTKTARFFIDSDYQSTLTYGNSGRYACWGFGKSYGGNVYQTGTVSLAYGAVVKGTETDEEILANISRISTKYAGILG